MNNLKRIGIAALLVLVCLFIAGFWWQNGKQPVNAADTSKKIFVIEKATGMREIANNLKAQGLIKDPVVFFLLVKQLKLDNKIQAGDFRLSPSMNAEQIAKELTTGTLDIWVQFNPGQRAAEVAEILKKEFPQYDDSWITKLEENEGYLSPDRYLIPRDYTIENIIDIFTSEFYKKLESAGIDKNRQDLQNIVITASLLEREANTNDEKPIIAGIIQNRLNADIGLQIDATIQYAKGKIGDKWWNPVTLEEYKSVKSPYNTYLVTGLPPGPISNPGIESLKAAANPQKTSYLYYLHGRDGVIRYARTLEEHNANTRKYLY